MKKFEKYAIAAIELGGSALLLIEGIVLSLIGVCILVVSITDSENLFDLTFGLIAACACGVLASVIFSMFKSNKQ